MVWQRLSNFPASRWPADRRAGKQASGCKFRPAGRKKPASPYVAAGRRGRLQLEHGAFGAGGEFQGAGETRGAGRGQAVDGVVVVRRVVVERDQMTCLGQLGEGDRVI